MEQIRKPVQVRGQVGVGRNRVAGQLVAAVLNLRYQSDIEVLVEVCVHLADVDDLSGVLAREGIVDKSAASFLATEQAFVLKDVQRFADRHAADAELLCQRVL